MLWTLESVNQQLGIKIEKRVTVYREFTQFLKENVV